MAEMPVPDKIVKKLEVSTLNQKNLHFLADLHFVAFHKIIFHSQAEYSGHRDIAGDVPAPAAIAKKTRWLCFFVCLVLLVFSLL